MTFSLRLLLTAFAWTLAGFLAAHAQTPPPTTTFQTGEPDGREYRLHIRPAALPTACEFWWHQTGPFGGYGGPPKRTGTGEFTLRTGFGGKPASTLKISVWCRGFAMALVDETELATSSFERTIVLTPLQELPVAARVLNSPDFVSLAGAKVRVLYRADWLCSFFNLADCIVPQWEVAAGFIANDSTLRIMVPDFANDKAVKKWASAPPFALDAGRFLIQVNRSSPPYDYWLEPDGRTFQGIPVATDYPQLFMRPRRH